MKKLLLGFLILTTSVYSQTFTGGSGPINDNQTIDIPVNVSGLPTSIDTANFGLETVCLDITHTWDADLTVWIVAPDGTSSMLFSNIGSGDDNFTNTCLNQDAASPIISASAPFTGTFIPTGQMGLINNGQNPNGTWYLRVTDGYTYDEGTVNSFSITFGNNPATYFVFRESWLPIVLIDTDGNTIVDDPKIMASMQIIDNGPGNRNHVDDIPNQYDGKIGIELRGSTSQTIYPKKSYGFETWDINGNSIDTVVLGMPKESDWVLVSAYSDKTLFRNELTYRIWREMGNYASRGEPVDVVINGEYLGVYFIGEKIKRNKNRVDIAKLKPTDIYGDDLTGGYILKIDKLTGSGNSNYWPSLYPAPNNSNTAVNITIQYPKDEDIVPQQLDYIHTYVDSFETALHGTDFQDPVSGWRNYADENSFVDYLLLSEFCRNTDAYRASCYFFKDKNSNGGKLKMGPAWDYDLTYGNVDFCEAWHTDNWAYDFNYNCANDSWLVPFWWERLLQDTLFQHKVRCRWEYLRSDILSQQNLMFYCDSMATYLSESQGFNYTVWPIIGTYVWPNHAIADSYQGEVDTLKQWITDRVQFMDANLPDPQLPCNYLGLSSSNDLLSGIQVYPNPSDAIFTITISGSTQAMHYTLITPDGKTIRSGQLTTSMQLNLETMPSGMYFLQLDSAGTIPLIKR